jgi:hypothetical protein
MALVLAGSAAAQSDKALTALNGIEKKMSPAQREMMSAGGRNMLHVARNFSGSKHIVPTFAAQQKARAMAAMPRRSMTGTPGAPAPINDPQLDLQLSRLAGFTQSESSSAWCGNAVVTGFNDSAAFLLTAGTTNGGASFSGVSVSNDGGKSFRDLGTLNPGSDNTVFLGGDPVVACSNQSTFFYASLLSAADGDGNPLSGVSINLSTDGGNTWSTPSAALLKDGFSHFIDKEWLTVDHNNPQRLYVTYTDFDSSPEAAQGCHFGFSLPRTAIEMVSSMDGGRSWSAPVVVHEVHCGAPGEVDQGSQVLTGPNGEVYVSFLHKMTDSIEVSFRRSTDHGATFEPIVTIASSDYAGIFQGFAQDFYRINSFPSLGVDMSKGANRGTLYVTWAGPSGSIFDFTSFTGFYNFGGTFLSRSNDGGGSWSSPTLVSPVLPQFQGPGRDQFFPSVAVDRSGKLAVCYYDRRNDAANNAMDRYCSYSNDGGSSFGDVRETISSWLPAHDTDLVINPTYMGDYDTVVSDTTAQATGFFDSFQVQNGMNPDVVGVRSK